MAVDQKTDAVHKGGDAEVSGLYAARELSTASGALFGLNGTTPAAIPALDDAATAAQIVTHLKTIGLAIDP